MSVENFDIFMFECNKFVRSKIGITAHCLPDAPWRDYHEDGLSVEDACECAMLDCWADEIPGVEEGWYM